jgi:hypothetical protein
MLVFSSQNCELLPVSDLTLPPPPFPSVNKQTVYSATCTQCVRGGGVWVSGPAAKSIYLDDYILHCILRVLSFYGSPYTKNIIILFLQAVWATGS